MKRCIECGKDFTPNDYRQKFCSRKCGVVFNNKTLRIGKKHPLWKSNKTPQQRDKTKDRARWAVYSAVKRGILIRQPCQICGLVKSEAHHKDYFKPLEIEWLCRKHHREADYRDKTKSGDFGH